MQASFRRRAAGSSCRDRTRSAAAAPAPPARLVVRAYYVEEKKAPAPDVVFHHPASPKFKNQLEALKSMSVVVADSGEIELVRKYHPQDCTTNPRSGHQGRDELKGGGQEAGGGARWGRRCPQGRKQHGRRGGRLG